MAIRNIVKIDEEKCNGCGQCVSACAEGAIQIINGKARLVKDSYCDGLGACLGHCPQDAITVEKREAAEFDEEAAMAHVKAIANTPPATETNDKPFVCPGSMMKTMNRPTCDSRSDDTATENPSQLSHWPVQMMLVSPNAPYFKDADLLWAADCVPFAYADFHKRFLAGKSVIMGCPKLDDTQLYAEKLAEILTIGKPKSLTVLHMEVPCCSGMTRIAKEAIISSGAKIKFDDVTININGDIGKIDTLEVTG